MGQETKQLKQHIVETRSQLERNLDELQVKFKQSLDWHVQIDSHPMLMLGLAFGAGALLSMVGSNGMATRRSGEFQGSYVPRDPNEQKAEETLDKIKAALVGFAASSVESILEEALPGFRDEYRRIEIEREQVRTAGPTTAAA